MESGSRPRVVLFTEQVRPGGKRSHAETLRAGLELIGWEASIFDWAHLSWPERAWVAGPLHALDRLQPALGHRWMVPTFTERMAARFRRFRRDRGHIDVVHVQEAGSYVAARRGALGVPIVLTVHGPWHREIAMVTGFGLSHPTIQWLKSIEERAFLEADAVISVDKPHAEYLRSFGRKGPIWTIVNFVDTRQFNDQVAAVPFDPEVEAWLAGRPVIFCPRRLVPKNGVTAAVRAMAVLKSRGVRCALVVAGYGPQRPEVEALIRELGVAGEVRLLGSVEPGRMAGWYRRSVVVVVPSISIKGVEEATSISALEGQACGRPVIASAIGGLPEIVEDGVTGLLVPGDRPEALADAIERTLQDEPLAAALGHEAARFVRAEHSHEAAAREYAAVYDTVR